MPPGCVRIIRVGLRRHLCGAGKGQNRAKIYQKQSSQPFCLLFAPGKALVYSSLRIDIQMFRLMFSMLSVLDANVCNPGCIYLQPHLQIFASWKTSVHLYDFFSLQSQNCCSWGCIEKSFRLQIYTPNPPKQICSGGFGVRCSAPDG